MFLVSRILGSPRYFSKLIFEEIDGIKTMISPVMSYSCDINGYVIICVDSLTNNIFEWHLIIELLTILISISWSYPSIFVLNDTGSLFKFEFTAREKQVINLLKCGYKDKYIADKLYLSLPTVRKHMKSIYDKSGVNCKSEFIAIYYQRQLSNII